jgi:hypothetical protein
MTGPVVFGLTIFFQYRPSMSVTASAKPGAAIAESNANGHQGCSRLGDLADDSGACGPARKPHLCRVRLVPNQSVTPPTICSLTQALFLFDSERLTVAELAFIYPKIKVDVVLCRLRRLRELKQ